MSNKGSGGGGSKVLKCTCTHEYQDSVYGKSMRVHTLGRHIVMELSDKSKKRVASATCTVCGHQYGQVVI